jgi:broad specificity phosphatase PhoE
MKEVVVIRHGEKIDDNLTPDGAIACKALAKRIGTFKFAIASERHRAIQTAELVSHLPVQSDVRANVPSFPEEELVNLTETQEIHPLGIIGAIWEKESLINDARVAGEKLLDLVKQLLDQLLDGERALIVSHDGSMIGLEKLINNESFGTVDHSFGPLQGIVIDEELKARPFNE